VKKIPALSFAIFLIFGLFTLSADSFTLMPSSVVGGPKFSPSDIAGLQFWVKADQIPSLSDGDPVTTWSDQSGEGRDLTQATAAKKPTYQTNEENGKPAVRFDGTDDTMASATFDASVVQPSTIFMVGLINTLGPGNKEAFTGLTEAARQALYKSGDETFRIFADVELVGPSGTTAISIWTAVFNGTSSSLQINAGTPTSGNAGTDDLGGATVGSKDGGSINFWPGDIYEILVYDSDLSSEDDTRVRNYLNEKYAVY